MYILVKLLNGFQEPLLYQIPDLQNQTQVVGRLVRVPLKQRLESALVVEQFAQKPENCSFNIKSISHFEAFPRDKHYASFIQKIGRYYCQGPIRFIKRIRHFLEQKSETEDSSFQVRENASNQMPTLTTHAQLVHCIFLVINVTFAHNNSTVVRYLKLLLVRKVACEPRCFM